MPAHMAFFFSFASTMVLGACAVVGWCQGPGGGPTNPPNCDHVCRMRQEHMFTDGGANPCYKWRLTSCRWCDPVLNCRCVETGSSEGSNCVQYGALTFERYESCSPRCDTTLSLIVEATNMSGTFEVFAADRYVCQ